MSCYKKKKIKPITKRNNYIICQRSLLYEDKFIQNHTLEMPRKYNDRNKKIANMTFVRENLCMCNKTLIYCVEWLYKIIKP